MALLLLAVAQQANAQALPFEDCPPTMFISQGPNDDALPTPVHTIDTSTNPFTFVPFIPLPGVFRHNALGYNPVDDFLYAIRVGSGPKQLIRFGRDANPEIVGTVANLPAGNYNSGTFGDDGTYYLRQANANNRLYRVNVNASGGPSALPVITMTGGGSGGEINSADMAYINGKLYTIATGTHQLYEINATNGNVTRIGGQKASSGLTAFGAMFVAENGLFASINDGGFYQVDMTNGALTRISDSPSSNNNDGAKCQNVPITFAADLSVTKTNTPSEGPNDLPEDLYVPGETRTYTIVVTNNGPQFGAGGVTVSDPLPEGIDSGTASWTCSGTGGGTCTANGSGAINDAGVGLPVNATVTYLLTLTVPMDFTGPLSNTVTVTPGPATFDGNMDNNTATDTDYSVPVADLWVTKTNTPGFGPDDQDNDGVLTGTQTTYDIVFGNDGPFAVENALLADEPRSGLTGCALDEPACEVLDGGATCPNVGTAPGLLSMDNLASASVVVPSLPAGSSIRVRITCTVQ